jgi:hypothetical protein
MPKFDEYLQGPSEHPDLDALPLPALADFQNLILYGPAGGGKYTHMLRIVRRYSAHHLKYEKRIPMVINDTTYVVRISDVHYEVDMATLGCTPKVLWHEIHAQITEIIQCKFPDRHGIIVCKNFQAIDGELLEIFYSYMQDSVRYILLTDALSFLPTNVTGRCRVIAVPKVATRPRVDSVAFLCQKVVDALRDHQAISAIREELYTILVYDVDPEACMWFFVQRSFRGRSAKERHEMLQRLATSMRYYTTNYRPIYHLESVVFRLAPWLV